MRVLLVTCLRNEGAFLLDWVAHHRSIGVTDILLYTNDCEDGTDAIAARLDRLGFATHVPNPRRADKPIQWQALGQANTHPFFKAADWVISADVDEYLNIHVGDGRLDDLFAARPGAEGFAIPWRLFGNDGHTKITAQPVPERFTRAAPEVLMWPLRARCYKSVWRNGGAFKKIGVHRPQGLNKDHHNPDAWYDGAGQTIPQSITKGMLPTLLTPQPQYAMAQWNHYALGSAEDFLLKAWRGKPNHEAEKIDLHYWTENNFCDVVDTSIQERRSLSLTLRQELAGDPELAKLHQAALDWRSRKVTELLQEEYFHRLFAAIRTAGPSIALSIEEQATLIRRHAQVVRRKSPKI